MTLTTNNAEGGFHGTAVAVGQAMSGTPFSAVNVGANATLKYDNTQAAHGSLSYRCGNNGTTNANTASVFLPGALSTSYATRFYIRFNTLPGTTGQTFMNLVNGGTWRIAGTNQFAIGDQSGGAVKTFATTISTGVWYRLELEIVSGTGFGPNGYLAGRYFLGDSTTPVEAAYSSNVQNTGNSNAFAGASFGITGPTPFQLYDLWIDDLAVNDGTTTPIGPAAAGPTVRSTGVAKSYPGGASRTAVATRTPATPVVYSRSAVTRRSYPATANRTVAGAARTWSGTVPSIPATPAALSTGQLWPRGKR